MLVQHPGYTFSCIVNMSDKTVKLPVHLSTVIGLHSTFGLIHANVLQPNLPGQVIVVSGDKSVINEKTEIILNPADVLLFVIVVEQTTDEAYAELTIGKCHRNDGMHMLKWVLGSVVILILILILFTIFMQDDKHVV